MNEAQRGEHNKGHQQIRKATYLPVDRALIGANEVSLGDQHEAPKDHPHTMGMQAKVFLLIKPHEIAAPKSPEGREEEKEKGDNRVSADPSIQMLHGQIYGF